MVQKCPGGSLLSALFFLWLGGRKRVHHFWDCVNVDLHDLLTIGSGLLFVAVPVSTDVTWGEHKHKVVPVGFGAIFLFVRGGPLVILKENRHVVGYLSGHFEIKVPELPW